MVLFHVTYIAEDKEAIRGFYEEAVKGGVVSKSREEKGCICYEYSWPAERENELFLKEKWTDRDVHKSHTYQEHFKFLGTIKEKYGIETEVESYDV